MNRLRPRPRPRPRPRRHAASALFLAAAVGAPSPAAGSSPDFRRYLDPWKANPLGDGAARGGRAEPVGLDLLPPRPGLRGGGPPGGRRRRRGSIPLGRAPSAAAAAAAPGGGGGDPARPPGAPPIGVGTALRPLAPNRSIPLGRRPRTWYRHRCRPDPASMGTAAGRSFRKTGTTIVGCLADGGSTVVLAADTRATDGTTVADAACEKVHRIADNVWCCGAGTSGDIDALVRKARYSLLLRGAVAGSIGNLDGGWRRRRTGGHGRGKGGTAAGQPWSSSSAPGCPPRRWRRRCGSSATSCTRVAEG